MLTRLKAENRRQDVLAVVFIVLGYIIGVLIMPIGRDFALLDDWAYVRAAEKIANGQGPAPMQIAQATFLTQGYFGALFFRLFGTGFTTATAATMVMSLLGAITFYILLRQIGLSSGLSLLGTAILALNPYYLYLSYTFMTEITFMALMLLACLFYLLGLKGDDRWLWLGSVFAALTFLTRQFGIALPVAALLWLFWARKLTPARAIATALLPLVAVIAYQLWSSGFGTTYSASVSREEILALFRSPVEWLHRAAHFVFFALFLPGLTIPLWGSVRRWRMALPLAALAALVVYILWQAKFGLVTSGSGSLNEISYTWLQRIFPDPTWVYCLGAALSVLLLFGIVENGWPSILAFVRRQADPPPAAFFFLGGAILFVSTYVVSAGFLDRYWLPLLPFLIAAGLLALRSAIGKTAVPVVVRVTMPVVFAVTVLFGIAVHLDDYEASSKSWQAARWVVAQGVPLEKIENGYDWDGYYLYDESMKAFPNPDVTVVGRTFPPYNLIDPQYAISTQTRPGYTVVQRFPYFSILAGMKSMDMLVLKRD